MTMCMGAEVSPIIHCCGALPLKGDGSAPCGREAFHRGLHAAKGGLRFKRIEPGSSPRSPSRQLGERASASSSCEYASQASDSPVQTRRRRA